MAACLFRATLVMRSWQLNTATGRKGRSAPCWVRSLQQICITAEVKHKGLLVWLMPQDCEAEIRQCTICACAPDGHHGLAERAEVETVT